jgi:hypothetical protein
MRAAPALLKMRLCMSGQVLYIFTMHKNSRTMRPIEQKTNRRKAVEKKGLNRNSLFTAAVLTAFMLAVHVHASLPKGLMLNLDFNGIENGLIPSRALYPLHVPLGDLGTSTFNGRTVLVVEEGQGLGFPHSTLLDPDGSEWVAMMRVFATTDGIVMSQSNDEHGYVIFIKNGAVHASVQTGHSALLLSERPENGITECLNKWVSIEVKINSDTAMLIINRAYVGLIPLQEPLIAENCRIRIGQHDTLPAPMIRNDSVTAKGFIGAISSFKILRQ